MVTFQVDDVAPAAEPLPTQPLGGLFPEALLVGGDPALPVLEPDGVHPLLSAVGRAFADHRPLVLSPDAVWLTIAQGVAQHVRLNAEELRSRLVSHEVRKRLTVLHDGPMPTDAASWQHVAESFSKLLAAEVDDTDLFECDFSTSTDTDRIAGRVTMLDAYSSYFALWMVCVCGIPSITLTGTVEDWQKIRTRVDALESFDLATWCRSLRPITDHFVRAASGDVDTAFWQRIYSPADAYGGDVITGWIARLYPYLTNSGAQDRPNPLLDLPIDEPRNDTSPGIRSDSVPATLSQAIVNINDRVTGANKAVALHAGVTGIAQAPDGALRPVSGWHLTPATIQIDEVIDRIIRDHETTPPEPGHSWSSPADLVAIYRRMGSATLFNNTWRLLPAADQGRVFRGPDHFSLTTVIDLPDGRSIAAAADNRTQTHHWITCRIQRSNEPFGDDHLLDDPADIPVYGTSLAMLLDAALDANGDISHLETTRLAHLETPTT
ncbi:DUF4419 domain-containing protein [Actinomadura barringtoniae]|uniref:DUF4419 domain-containing protein n=1 Tax=Actinomadura barringtoniae TaxID=1427535 RepID=A0A939PEG1_9ACTN|nr:DUF4419 domain-containing protein [Actinomadura barringtoniae]MBO2451125.1 DUF4419 domain-containing protein [Actinomadura barringtoniae]